MYLDKQLQEYLDDLASSRSTPGGGSASAVSGAMAAALACMVSRLTLASEKYTSAHAEIAVILDQAEQLRSQFQKLIQDDIEAYGRLSACFKMPRSTPDEKAARTVAIQAELVRAALVPLDMAERAAELIIHCRRIAEIGNKSVLSDIATAAMLTSGAATGASWMVRANVQSLKDQAKADELNERLSDALETIAAVSQDIMRTVGGHEA